MQSFPTFFEPRHRFYTRKIPRHQTKSVTKSETWACLLEHNTDRLARIKERHTQYVYMIIFGDPVHLMISHGAAAQRLRITEIANNAIDKPSNARKAHLGKKTSGNKCRSVMHTMNTYKPDTGLGSVLVFVLYLYGFPPGSPVSSHL